MATRKREKPYSSRHAPYNFSKRRRSLPLDSAVDGDGSDEISISSTVPKAPTMVVVIGVPGECSVLDLKSRFEMYGPICRTRMEPNGVAYINFRSNDAAQSAIDAAQDSSFPVTLHSVAVQVKWASDPVQQWGRGIARNNSVFSRLVRPELPLRRQGRENKLVSTIVNPRGENSTKKETNDDGSSSGVTAREIVGYDDIL